MKPLTRLLILAAILSATPHACGSEAASRPNILFVISDDQSWAHTGAAGYRAARTPAYDRIAAEGVLFENAFAPTPGCSPTRAAILTGRNNWQIEEAGTHASSFPTHYEVFPTRLQSAGYFIGMHGKGWGPGTFDGWPHNPAGPSFQGENYTDAFRNFLNVRPEDQPFLFWFGAYEPHPSIMRAKRGIGVASGYKLDDIEVPPFLPDVPEVRSQIADYLALIENYDTHLGQILTLLEESGELDNTLIIVTSDHGMGFPRAKANLYEYSTRVPLAVRWGNEVPSGRRVTDLVNLIDLTATIYEAAGVAPPQAHPIAGRSLLEILRGDGQGINDPTRDAVFCGRERHTSARYQNLGYPMRSIRTHEYLYIRNFAPERWPAGAPQSLNPNGKFRPIKDVAGMFADIDPGVAMAFMFENRHHEAHRKFFLRSIVKRPAEELFDVRADPGCLINLASEPRYEETRAKLATRLNKYLHDTRDPRVVGPDPAIFESYPRLVGAIRNYPPPEDEPEAWREFEAP